MHMAHIVREMRGVAPTANGFFFFYSKLDFSASISHGLSHTPHRKWRFQSTNKPIIAPAKRLCMKRTIKKVIGG
jgi:hypothetical protein